MMYGGKKIPDTPASGCMYAKKVTCARKYRRFVHHHPILHPVAKVFCANFSVIGKPCNNVPVCPSAFVFQRLWQVPVIDSYPGLYTLFDAVIYHPVIIVYSGLVHLTYPGWHNARPRNRKPKIRNI